MDKFSEMAKLKNHCVVVPSEGVYKGRCVFWNNYWESRLSHNYFPWVIFRGKKIILQYGFFFSEIGRKEYPNGSIRNGPLRVPLSKQENVSYSAHADLGIIPVLVSVLPKQAPVFVSVLQILMVI